MKMKKMVKKFSCAVIASVILLSAAGLSGLTSYAAGEFQVGADAYADLNAAAEAVPEGGTILMLSDVETAGTVGRGGDTVLDGDKSYIIDLGGYTLSNAGDVNNLFYITAGEVTIRNGALYSDRSTAVTVEGGAVILDDVEIRADGSDSGRDVNAVGVVGGSATILSGGYYGTTSAVHSMGGTIYIASGEFACDENGYYRDRGGVVCLRQDINSEILPAPDSEFDADAWVNKKGVTEVMVEPPFVPMTGITGVPVKMTEGTALTLTGTVTPADATNRTIIWSVSDGGGTGAYITGAILYAETAGTVILSATVTGGLGVGIDGAFNFTITVKPKESEIDDLPEDVTDDPPAVQFEAYPSMIKNPYTPPIAPQASRGAGPDSYWGNQNDIFVKGSDSNIAFIIKRDFSFFNGKVAVDGKRLTENVHFTAESGSTKVILFPEYLDSLSDGEHEIIVYFRGAVSVASKFEVMTATDNVSTDAGGYTNLQ